MKRAWKTLAGIGLFFFLTACEQVPVTTTTSTILDHSSYDSLSYEEESLHMDVIINDLTFKATLADSETGLAFRRLLPLTLTLNDVNQNEKYVVLPEALPTNTYQPGTIHSGDIMLWGSSGLVLFYETFTSSYSYTRIGTIDDLDGYKEALGSGGVTITFQQS